MLKNLAVKHFFEKITRTTKINQKTNTRRKQGKKFYLFFSEIQTSISKTLSRFGHRVSELAFIKT